MTCLGSLSLILNAAVVMKRALEKMSLGINVLRTHSFWNHKGIGGDLRQIKMDLYFNKLLSNPPFCEILNWLLCCLSYRKLFLCTEANSVANIIHHIQNNLNHNRDRTTCWDKCSSSLGWSLGPHCWPAWRCPMLDPAEAALQLIWVTSRGQQRADPSTPLPGSCHG